MEYNAPELAGEDEEELVIDFDDDQPLDESKRCNLDDEECTVCQ